ncbi:MAG: pyridoxal 5'-phosphate synthase glutaminase subunit PdxT [Candidatus Rokuibacteriota bacterium]|nr:MAG: pyridoxal 5'-phosphate synthase glutaminase subunit PdxT [Candidatus Rokubacteria bacterium]
MRIGVLALQGDFARHARALQKCGSRPSAIEVVEIRKPEQLEDIDGLIMPGGESTTLLKLMDAWGFVPALEKFHAGGKPIFGTCAGLILTARDVANPAQFSLGLIDVGVERNAYGRQRESFEAAGTAVLDGRPVPIEMVFIRAPRIRRVGPGVETLARHGDEPVMARQGSVLVATFHPELTDDPTVHEYFCRMVKEAKRA